MDVDPGGKYPTKTTHSGACGSEGAAPAADTRSPLCVSHVDCLQLGHPPFCRKMTTAEVAALPQRDRDRGLLGRCRSCNECRYCHYGVDGTCGSCFGPSSIKGNRKCVHLRDVAGGAAEDGEGRHLLRGNKANKWAPEGPLEAMAEGNAAGNTNPALRAWQYSYNATGAHLDEYTHCSKRVEKEGYVFTACSAGEATPARTGYRQRLYADPE